VPALFVLDELDDPLAKLGPGEVMLFTNVIDELEVSPLSDAHRTFGCAEAEHTVDVGHE
jgi:hypothetical protein